MGGWGGFTAALSSVTATVKEASAAVLKEASAAAADALKEVAATAKDAKEVSVRAMAAAAVSVTTPPSAGSSPPKKSSEAPPPHTGGSLDADLAELEKMERVLAQEGRSGAVGKSSSGGELVTQEDGVRKELNTPLAASAGGSSGNSPYVLVQTSLHANPTASSSSAGAVPATLGAGSGGDSGGGQGPADDLEELESYLAGLEGK